MSEPTFQLTLVKFVSTISNAGTAFNKGSPCWRKSESFPVAGTITIIRMIKEITSNILFYIFHLLVLILGFGWDARAREKPNGEDQQMLRIWPLYIYHSKDIPISKYISCLMHILVT